MWTMKSIILPLLMFVTVVFIADARDTCPDGWDILCGDENKCARPMSDFKDSRMCLKRGGIPGASICLQRGSNDNITEVTARMCVKDLKKGKFGFAKNLRNAVARVDKKEKMLDEEEEAIDEFEAPMEDIAI